MTDILIVEDNEELADILCDFLRAENYTVSVAKTGEKALPLYEKYGARLIVLDVMLPGIDGFAVCRKIREESDTPILIVSAKVDKEDKLNGLILGADDYIEKQNQGSASDFISKMPEGYDTVVGERGVGLSGGQKQRISLARALAVRPSILILDDTTSAVDMETEKQIQEALRHLDFSCTKVIIAQRISTTMMADKILVMQHGRITEMGNHEELMAKKGYYYELVQLQTGEDLV